MLEQSDWVKFGIEQEYITLFKHDSFKEWKIIGRGGFGAVYSAFSKDVEKIIALKSFYCRENDISPNGLIKEHDRNILVHNGILMITDFGLSKTLDNSTKSIHGGTCGFSDPKYLQSPYMYKRDKFSDIYSLGVLFWELSSGVPPFKDSDQYEITLNVINGKREAPINGTPVDFMTIYCDAWNGDPNLRPSITEICNLLDKLDYTRTVPVYHSKQDTNLSSENSLIINNHTENQLESLNHGIECYKLERYDESLVILNKLLKINQNNAEALKYRGATYCMMNRYEESLADLNQSLKINTNNEETLIYRGVTYSMLNKFEESLTDLNKSLEINPDNAFALVCRGETYRRMKKYKKSIADLRKLLDIVPSLLKIFKMINLN
ncbi:hypothetical protein C2G38_2029444 [Gigaspora rosea]|uniref:Protein kinase domain-containing protein n=1 Tax=Gigaspora rosea TaxID=44941 RepID=A0A397W292_9GLOM|nr:hypothetical protein C2G38_2029444 [Gigaspora rosea]